jgi:hypothetical protein
MFSLFKRKHLARNEFVPNTEILLTTTQYIRMCHRLSSIPATFYLPSK